MKKRLLTTLFIMSLCSFFLAGCGSSAPTSEPENTETTIAVEPETTPTPEAEPETKEETKETEAVETETVETTETETQTEATETEKAETEESSAYTFTDMDATKYAKSSVNVRSLPDTSGDKLGGLNTNDEVHITGQCNETGWFRFEYNGSVAYVSNSYLVDEKVEVAPSIADTGSNNSAPSNLENCPYQLNTWTYNSGANIFTCYGAYSNYRGFVDAYYDGKISGWEQTGGHSFWRDGYNYHTTFNVTYIGEYAEGKIYKCDWGAHYTTDTCNKNNCIPGTIN